MSEAKYTPGPWEWSIEFNELGGQYYRIRKKGGSHAFTIADEIRTDNEHDVIVMAAATELLEALENLTEKVTNVRGIDMDMYAYMELEQAYKAITKAKGHA